MIPLSKSLHERLHSTFPQAEDAGRVRRALEAECGVNLNCSAREVELVRMAVLKVAAGQMTTFRLAVALAKIDWRDALAAAGYSHGERDEG